MRKHPIISHKRTKYVNKAREPAKQKKIRRSFDEVFISRDDAEELNEGNTAFSMDGTCFSMAPKGNLVLGERGQHLYDESMHSNKENTTTLLTVNDVGKITASLTLYK